MGKIVLNLEQELELRALEKVKGSKTSKEYIQKVNKLLPNKLPDELFWGLIYNTLNKVKEWSPTESVEVYKAFSKQLTEYEEKYMKKHPLSKAFKK